MRWLGSAVLLVVACSAPPPAGGHVELLAAPADGEVAPWIAAQVASRPGRQVLVYVGASWCEPCQYFHQAAVSGQLDARFPRLTLLEFDADRDDQRLTAAGYHSGMIPLFARIAADGRASDRHIEGSIKGPGAVDQIIPRLTALLTN